MVLNVSALQRRIRFSDTTTKFGYTLDVELLYPDHLHDAHSDNPLAPTEEIVSKMWLSELQLDMLKN